MRGDILSIIIGGICGVIVILLLRYWRKIRVTSITSLGLILIFIPRALRIGAQNDLGMVIFDLALAVIGVILVGIDVQRVGRRERRADSD